MGQTTAPERLLAASGPPLGAFWTAPETPAGKICSVLRVSKPRILEHF